MYAYSLQYFFLWNVIIGNERASLKYGNDDNNVYVINKYMFMSFSQIIYTLKRNNNLSGCILDLIYSLLIKK